MSMGSKKKIIAIVGKSGSGKTTFAEMLSDVGVPPVASYTTRPKRTPNEKGHVFVSDEEFDQLMQSGKVIASTVYGDYRYAGAFPDSDSNTFSYVIDESGIRDLMELEDIEIVKVRILASAEARKERVDEKRFERDKDYQFRLNYDQIILNISTFENFKKYCNYVIKKVL